MNRNSPTAGATIVLVAGLFLGGLLVEGCGRSHGGAAPPSSFKFNRGFKRFVEQKEAQARDAARTRGQTLLPEYETLFKAASRRDWESVQKTFGALARRAPQYEHAGPSDERLTGIQWQAVLETYGGLEAFVLGGEKYSAAFGRDIIDSVPPGSIYFGGTDPGRFIVTEMCRSHVDADPFFTLTQNALADSSYLAYLRAMYGGRIRIPTDEDSQRCFQEYVDDAQRRKQRNQLKPGERVEVVNGKPSVSGRTAVMSINGLLVKWIFDRNPDREFYVEESFPLDWMYPYVEPHGLIFRIDREPLQSLPDSVVQQDREYWTHYVEPMIGGWLTFNTPVTQVAERVEKVDLKKDLDGFEGDPEFLQNGYARRTFSKLRGNIANIYLWRMEHADGPEEGARMAAEADFALRQAWALCPDSDEIVFRYVNFLAARHRVGDAVLVGETASHLPQLQVGRGAQLRDLIKQLKSRNAL